MGTHAQYFVHQETRFKASMWSDHPLIDEHPYLGDRENYFPTIKNYKSYNYGPIVNDRTQRESVNFEEIGWGISEVSI